MTADSPLQRLKKKKKKALLKGVDAEFGSSTESVIQYSTVAPSLSALSLKEANLHQNKIIFTTLECAEEM